MDLPRVSFPSSRVLLVDDTPANLQVLSELLESAGFEIQIAASGADALRCLSMAPAPDLVLMDVMMPEMDGFETCRRMKQHHALRDIPVIFISASESVENRVAGFAVGGVDYISKPFHADEVVARVGTHCRLTRIEALTREIMERQAAEANLRAEEEKYRAILKTALDGFLLIDMDGQILESNDAYCIMSGYSIEELKTLGLFGLEATYNREQILDSFLTVKSIGYARFTTTHRRKDGTTFSVEVSVKFRSPDNGQLVAFLRDLTQIKEEQERQRTLEEKLSRHQRMEAIGRLAGGIAHDFNNMLGVIIGNVELAVFDLPTAHPVQASLSEVLKAARRSTNLTQQLLTFARKQPVVQHTIDLNKCVGDTIGMLHRVIGENITLEWTPCRSPIFVKLGDSQLDQILTNLCLNAKDSIEGCGKIEVVASEILLDRASAILDSECNEGHYGVLTVKDNGSGMDAGTIKHAFEPFFTTKSQGKGTGLGLSTVEGIVRQCGGFLTLDSERGVGSAFSLYFPIEPISEKLSAGSEILTENDMTDKTILLVEDEPSLLQLTKTMLERIGYHVVGFESSLDALQAVVSGSISMDLLITDVMMPGMNGAELRKRIEEHRPGLPYLYISGHPAEISSELGIIPEGISFLQKPFNMNRLAIKLRQILEINELG
ncbi:MAG: hypothetical protein RL173_883 [Fibrobacterota bacterium]|jgi:PAS domain S-box-containing protein